jgi:hypothetical protein
MNESKLSCKHGAHRIGAFFILQSEKNDLVPLFGTQTNIEKEVFHESEKSLYAGVQI